MKSATVDILSCTSLKIIPKYNDYKLATATGFCIGVGDARYIVTNWHVVSGRNPANNKCLDKNLSVPNHMIVRMHKAGALNAWVDVTVPLLSEEEEPLWFEHEQGRAVDVVVVKLVDNSDVDAYVVDEAYVNTDMLVYPAMAVSIIGYPLGLGSGENWPIWKTGHIASEPSLDYKEGRPSFLIDATTKFGMSGSPVVLRAYSGYASSSGMYTLDGSSCATKLLGVYSGRIHKKSEVGEVWRTDVIGEILKFNGVQDADGRTPFLSFEEFDPRTFDGVSPGKQAIMTDMVNCGDGNGIKVGDVSSLISLIEKIRREGMVVDKGVSFNGGALTGLLSGGILGKDYEITKYGVKMFAELAARIVKN